MPPIVTKPRKPAKKVNASLKRREQPMTTRGRFEIAETDRLNRKSWINAKTNHVNFELAPSYETIRQRCIYEAANNPYVEGVIGTHAVDIVGEDGPSLQVNSENTEYNNQLESLWNWWTSHCDINGEMSLADFMRRDFRSMWTMGEFIHQFVNDPREKYVQTKLNDIDPRRLNSPMRGLGDPKITMGIKRNATGKPEAYFFDAPIDSTFGTLRIGESEEISAAFIIHGFDANEPGQARGIPWLSQCLQTIADLRELDKQTLDAVRAAADHAVLLETQDPDGTPPSIEAGSTIDYERRQITALPAGVIAKFAPANQPGAQYIEFRSSLMAGLGRPVGMPLMMVMLDSSEHNFSSARFDGRIYQRTGKTRQAWLERKMLNRCVERIAREGELSGAITAKRPPKVTLKWTWPVAPEVDPYKEASAEDVALNRNRTTSRTAAAAAKGNDYEQVQIERNAEALKENAMVLAQIETLQKACDSANTKNPNLKIHWSQVAAIGGAVTAPGAFLQGFAPRNSDEPGGGDPLLDDEDKSDKKSDGNRMRGHLLNGVHG